MKQPCNILEIRRSVNVPVYVVYNKPYSKTILFENIQIFISRFCPRVNIDFEKTSILKIGLFKRVLVEFKCLSASAITYP